MVNSRAISAPPPPPERDQDTEERILAAAHAVFLRDGTYGARMQEIADEAGVNKALLHYYFRSKERLADEVFRRTFAAVIPQVLQTLAGPRPLEEKVREVARIYIGMLSQNAFLPGYLLCEMHQHPDRLRETMSAIAPVPLNEVSERILGPLRRQLQAAARDGTARPMRVEHFVANLFGLCIFPFAARPMLGLVLGLEDEARFAAFAAEREREVTEFFLAALRSAP